MVSPGNPEMEALIPIINKLHDVFTQMGPDVHFDLPQIAVVGGQSAGKSSVLENFVGRDFLPRGTGIVTRRPLILQLINSAEEWGEFLHAKGKKFTKFEDIRAEIEADTTRVTGSNKGISNLPINLRIYSPHVLDITLIDLPGLTRNPIGDQPEDIEIQIRDMIFQYISKETCLILAVTPANVDIGTSDALKLAKMADPEGLRTIGVITKLDIMDAGTDASQILSNTCLPLKRGYIGVVNRSQKDIDGRKNILMAQEAEKKFFQTHPAYSRMAGKMGTPYLQKILSEQLTAHIRECLPALRAKLRKEEMELAKQVEKFKLTDPTFQTKALHQMVHTLQSDFRGTIRGYGPVGTTGISGGVKINYIFHEMFTDELAGLTPNEEELRREISFAVRNSHGIEMGIFTPNAAFQTVVRNQISGLTEPAMNCVDLVTKEFTHTMLGCLEKMKNFPRLREETEYIISNYVHKKSQICKDIIGQLLESEASYINSKHEDFVGSLAARDQKDSPQLPKRALDQAANPITMKGYLSVLNTGLIKGGAKYYWFVLNGDKLSWFKDDTEVEKRCEILLKGVNIRDDRNRNTFVLFHQDGKNIAKDFKQLVLTCDNEVDSWKESFSRAGVNQVTNQHFYVENSATGPMNGLDFSTNVTTFSDSQLDQQVETIRYLVDSYMKIVMRTIRDLVLKFITNFIIQKTQDFIDEDLLSQILAQDPLSLMAESKEEQARQNSILKTYHACKKSLQIINDVSLATSSTMHSAQIGRQSMRSVYHGVTDAVGNGTESQEGNRIVPVIPKRPVLPTPTPRERSKSPTLTDFVKI